MLRIFAEDFYFSSSAPQCIPEQQVELVLEWIVSVQNSVSGWCYISEGKWRFRHNKNGTSCPHVSFGSDRITKNYFFQQTFSAIGSHKVSRESLWLCQNTAFLSNAFTGAMIIWLRTLSHAWLKEGLCYHCKQTKLSKILNPSTAFTSRGNMWPRTSIVMLLSTKLSFH